MPTLAQLDRRYVWHPFTQMRDWHRREPIVIVSGQDAVLRDVRGRTYLDANSSIWTNLHGHNHPRLNAALRAQLGRIAHSSALGLANEPASLLAEQLVAAAQPFDSPAARSGRAPSTALRAGLHKVFFSDDGSTAMEVALKLAYEFARRTRGQRRPKFLSLEGGYHGDTIGAVSLGHIDLFHRAYAGLLFGSDRVMAPYCYRCPFNRARPERADAREYRRCQWECVDRVEQRLTARKKRGEPYAAFVFEPKMQGAAGMIPQPDGWLRRVATLARQHQTPLVADEVMTGFGRTGVGASTTRPVLFACQHEGVQPDFLVLAKGLTGGYLPMAATLTTTAVFEAFLGDYAEFKTFFHGHSYTGNQLGAAAGLASLKLLRSRETVHAIARLEKCLKAELRSLWDLPAVGDIRQAGLIAGVELVRDWRTRAPFALRERAGQRVCDFMARHGVLTRPIGNVVVLMPPYCTTPAQLEGMVATLRRAVARVLG
jgi:adenosylmethionine-8-amino-7-oxononanoate aminotransferase